MNYSDVDVVVLGGGQAGLATGFFLHRLQRDVDRGKRASAPTFAILDAAAAPGGAWQHYWPSLELFSPPEHSSLPGFQMPRWHGVGYPNPTHVVDYLQKYEQRYNLPINRQTRAHSVHLDYSGRFIIETNSGSWRTTTLINATGSWENPYIPNFPSRQVFSGRQIHSREYWRPQEFTAQRVAVVGAGNSGAQIASELLPHVASMTWFTQQPPKFMPDDVDGRVLFDVASAQVRSQLADTATSHDGEEANHRHPALGKIVSVPLVRQARDSGRLSAIPMFTELTASGACLSDGSFHPIDAIIWCTGFRDNLDHLTQLDLELDQSGFPTTERELPTRSKQYQNLYFMGHGSWTGPASATLVGVGVWARQSIAAIAP